MTHHPQKLFVFLIIFLTFFTALVPEVYATNTAGTFQQTHFRWRTDDGSETTASWLELLNTETTNVAATAQIRLRIGTTEGGTCAGTGCRVKPRLEFSSDATSCTTGTWTVISSITSEWLLYDSANFANSDPTTQQITSGTFAAGNMIDTTNPDAANTTMTQSGVTEDEYTVGGNSPAASTVYYFRVTNAGTVYNTYTQCAKLTTAAAATPDLSWDTGAADFEIWAGATATTDASLTWDNGTLICSTSLTDDNARISTCGSINKNQKYRVQNVLKNVGSGAATMASGDFVDQMNVKTFWAGTSPTISAASDCGFNDFDTDDTSTTCNVAFSGNDVRITNTGTTVLIAATTGTEGFMYLITTDSDVPLSDSSTYMNASIDTVTDDSSKVTIGLKRTAGNYIRGLIKIRGLVKFR